MKPWLVVARAVRVAFARLPAARCPPGPALTAALSVIRICCPIPRVRHLRPPILGNESWVARRRVAPLKLPPGVRMGGRFLPLFPSLPLWHVRPAGRLWMGRAPGALVFTDRTVRTGNVGAARTPRTMSSWPGTRPPPSLLGWRSGPSRKPAAPPLCRPGTGGAVPARAAGRPRGSFRFCCSEFVGPMAPCTFRPLLAFGDSSPLAIGPP